MPEMNPQCGRELKAGDLKLSLRVVLTLPPPYDPDHRVMTVVELTDTTVRFISLDLPSPKRPQRLGSFLLCRLRPDGDICVEDWQGTTVHMFEYLEPTK